MKVLLSAYACEPGRGSEPGVGWNMAREVANYHRVWVFTSNTHRSAIESELARNPLPTLNFIYLDPLNWVYDWSYEGKRSQWNVHLHYYLWQIWAYFIARSLHRELGFDFVHHVTYARYSSPSFLSLLPIPFLWGPVGGGESAPKSFGKDFSFRGRVYEALRDLARWLGEHDPFVGLTARSSALTLASTEETAEHLRKLKVRNVLIFSNVGLPNEDIGRLMRCTISVETAFVRFVSIGRLLHWKGVHLGLKAFASAKIEQAEYWIIGDGPERRRLEDLARNLGIIDKVFFWGTIPRDEMLSKLDECHVLIHPSLHDSGGGVCSEMMSAGRPVICLDLGGPAVQVTNETGFKVTAHSPEQVVCGLAEAIVYLAKDSELRVRMGQAGQKRVREVYSWKAKGQLLSQLYEEALKLQQTFGSA